MVRIQALRCNVIYCQSGTRLNVIPVLASRSQALRYLNYIYIKCVEYSSGFSHVKV